MPRVSVLMPVHDGAAFVARAVESLLAQTLADWELVVVDDGSTDATARVLAPYLADPRLSLRRLERNVGLGAALNVALGAARADLVAYLPADDVLHAGHLASLVDALDATGAVLAFSGVRHHYNRRAEGRIDGEALQLVQVMHRRTPDRWTERAELTTDDLGRMLWDKLAARGAFHGTGRVTCEWVDHPGQRHKTIREPLGGINPYRVRYGVREPLRFHSTVGNFIDEGARFAADRARPDTPRAEGGLNILLVGELAYNAERVLALEERGHRLFGLWMPDPYWYNWVGPLPFGHVRDLDPARWREEAREVGIDVIYGLLNWQAVPWAHRVLRERGDLPFVWHFKEGPFICLEKGTWAQLHDLYVEADGRIFTSDEMRDWYAALDPRTVRGAPALVLDGDLPRAASVRGERAARLSDTDDEIHTVVPGRPIGLHPHTVAELAAEGLHLHFYGDFTQGQWRAWCEKTRSLAGRFFHLHPNVDQERWVEEFSRYDAGWLHTFESRNGGDPRRADWDDLNIPARMATLAVCGLPMLQRDNAGHTVATQRLARDLDLGIFFRDIPDLGRQLRDPVRLGALRENVWAKRDLFTFDHHADRLVEFLREAAAWRRTAGAVSR